MRFGNLEKGIFIYVSGMMPFLILLYVNKIAVFKAGEQIPFWYSIMIIMGCFIMFMGLVWIVVKVRGTRAYVMMDEIMPDEIVDIRVTNDGIIVPTVARKGTSGKAETVCYGENADFMDDGEFRLRLINGCPAIITYDALNMAIDLRRSFARKKMKMHVENGIEGYKHWKIGQKLKLGKKEKYDVGEEGEVDEKEN